jgi:hypothetical protein
MPTLSDPKQTPTVDTGEQATVTPNGDATFTEEKNLLFVRNDGLAAVGHIDAKGHFVNTEARSDFAPNWSHVVAVA